MRREIENTIWLCGFLIMACGLGALYSASIQNVRATQEVFFDQLFFAGLGLILMFFLAKVDYRRFYDAAYIFYIINILVLVVVLLGGRHALGARRWLEVGGVSFQPSEFTKLALILMLSRYLSNRRPTLSFNFRSRIQIIFKELVIPFGLTAVLMLLIFKQPDLGTAILLFGIFVIMVFINGLEMKYLSAFLVMIASIAPFAWHILKPYQKSRLLVFLNPNQDPLGAGYTIIQSKIAIGSGQLFGKGWLSGTQSQLNFLPERHTDFIFSVIGEEWGLLGTIFLVSCYAFLIYNSFRIALHTKDKFGVLVAVGIIAIFSLQVVINVGMVMGLFPVVGITLPLVSYGRSSFLVFVTMLGILLNLNRKATIS